MTAEQLSVDRERSRVEEANLRDSQSIASGLRERIQRSDGNTESVAGSSSSDLRSESYAFLARRAWEMRAQELQGLQEQVKRQQDELNKAC
jgi:hypothetical protein